MADAADAAPADAAGRVDASLAPDTPVADTAEVEPERRADAPDAPDVPAVPDIASPDAPAAPDLPPASDTTTAPPIAQLAKLALALVIGDSVGAGYNATGLNAQGGQGFARMAYTNHPAWPKYQGHDLHTLHPAAQFKSLASSGDTSSDMLKVVQGALAGALPKAVEGDVLVLVHVGGNDFNDSPTVMVSAQATEAAAQKLRQNIAKALKLLRDRYEVGGKKLAVAIDGIHDPTDGKGAVPKQFTKGFCKALQNPLLAPMAATVMANLGKMNAALQQEAAAQGAVYVDLQAAFQGHGMNSGPERWVDDDCVHPTNPGHDLIRRKVWLGLTGQAF